MESTLSWVAQSLRAPFFELTVEETRATSTGSSRTVASSALTVKMQTTVTDAARSRGFW